VATHNVPNDGKAESGAASAKERLEDALEVFGRDAGSGVLDVNLPGAYNDADFPTRVHGRAGVAEEIIERTVDSGFVAVNGRKAFRDLDIETNMFGDAGLRRESANRRCEIRRF
jgi:hypothetical protein